MAGRFRRCPPYEGSDPYLYLCFAEEDREAVFPLLRHLAERGCRIWYSVKATADLEKLKRQQERMNGASLAVLFLTDHVRNNGNVKNSLLYFQQLGKPVISIDTDKGDNELSVGLTAAAKHIDASGGQTAEELEEALIRTEGFTQELIGDPPKIKRGTGRITAFILATALLVAGVAYYGWRQYGWFAVPAQQEEPAVSVTPAETRTPDPTKEPSPDPTQTASPTPTSTPKVTPTPSPEPTPGPTPTVTPIPDTVFFEDEALTAALRERMKDGVITQESLAEITELTLNRLPEDLSELEKLPNLNKLSLPQEEALMAGELMDQGITLVIRAGGEESP